LHREEIGDRGGVIRRAALGFRFGKTSEKTRRKPQNQKGESGKGTKSKGGGEFSLSRGEDEATDHKLGGGRGRRWESKAKPRGPVFKRRGVRDQSGEKRLLYERSATFNFTIKPREHLSFQR